MAEDDLIAALETIRNRVIAERAASAERIAALEGEIAALKQAGQPTPIPAPVPPVTEHAPRTSMSLGVNLSEWNEYATQAPAANVLSTMIGGYYAATRQQDPWGKPDKPWEPQPSLTFTPDGYPLSDAGAYTYAYGYPSGDYKFAMEGSGSVAFAGKGRGSSPFARGADGVLRGNVKFTQANAGVLQIKITGIDPANPPRNMRLMLPGTADADLYNPAFVAWIGQTFGEHPTLREMQQGRINGSPHVAWTNRKRPTEFTQTGPRGVSYEHMIELANLTNADVWLCMPHAADDDYVRNAAILFQTRLKPNLKVWLEYSNEVWNTAGGFGQSGWLMADAKSRGLTPEQANGWHARHNGQIWREVMGDRVRPILAGQQASVRRATDALEYLDKTGGVAPIVAVACGGYFSVAADVDQPGLTADQLFPHLESMIAGGTRKSAIAHKALADRFGLQYLVYEGGQHLTAWNGAIKQADSTTKGGEVNVQLKADVQRDPRMGERYTQLLNVHQDAGCALFMHFASVESGGKFGHWGLTENLGVDSPKLAAVKAWARK